MLNEFEAKMLEKAMAKNDVIVLKRLTKKDNKKLSSRGYEAIVVIEKNGIKRSRLLLRSKKDTEESNIVEYVKRETEDLKKKINRINSIAPTETGITLLTNILMEEIKREAAMCDKKLNLNTWKLYQDVEKRISDKFKKKQKGFQIYKDILSEEKCDWIIQDTKC